VFISGCKLPATALIAVATVLQSNNYILQLDVSNNRISTSNLTQTLVDDIMTHFGITLTINYGLKVLNISKMGISDFVMVNILAPALRENKTLETLNLSW
jgi:predicted TIM-barrel enzyme